MVAHRNKLFALIVHKPTKEVEKLKDEDFFFGDYDHVAAAVEGWIWNSHTIIHSASVVEKDLTPGEVNSILFLPSFVIISPLG